MKNKIEKISAEAISSQQHHVAVTQQVLDHLKNK